MKVRMFILLLALIFPACGGGSSSPAAAVPVAQCRTYATQYSTTTAGTSRNTNCSFDQSGVMNCTSSYTAGSCSFTQTTTDHYANAADFIAGGKLLGRTYALSSASTGSATGGAQCGAPVTLSTTYAYDGQRRLTAQSPWTTFSAWDNQGRPTIGSMSSGGLFSGTTQLAYRYDDSARTITLTLGSGQPPCGSSSVMRYDANLNLIGVDDLASGITTHIAINATANICQ